MGIFSISILVPPPSIGDATDVVLTLEMIKSQGMYINNNLKQKKAHEFCG